MRAPVRPPRADPRDPSLLLLLSRRTEDLVALREAADAIGSLARLSLHHTEAAEEAVELLARRPVSLLVVDAHSAFPSLTEVLHQAAAGAPDAGRIVLVDPADEARFDPAELGAAELVRSTCLVEDLLRELRVRFTVAPPAVHERRWRVLLVEDDAADAELARRSIELGSPGACEVAHALTLSRALELLSESAFDVVLLDLHLPDSDGLETLRRVRSRARRTPVLVLTGDGDDELGRLAVGVGAEDFLVKEEIPPRALVRLLRYAVERAELRAALDEGRRRTLSELHHRADHDPLTGLPNRAVLLERLGRSMRRGRREGGQGTALALLDLDGFKRINDEHGHLAGDHLLERVARRLATSVRPHDLVARLGGDEFAILFENVGNPGVLGHLVRRVLERIERPIPYRTGVLRCSASLGLVLCERRHESPEELLDEADDALYRVKAQGGAGWRVFDDAMQQRALLEMRLADQLTRALEGEAFCIELQLIEDVAERRAVGMEALIRWRHGERGLLLPAEFLPIAERTGQLAKIDRFALRRAAEALASLGPERLARLPLGVAVNASAASLRSPGFLDELEALLRELGIPPGLVRIEIDERLLTSHGQAIRQAVRGLRSLGARVVLDALGEGSASLRSLVDLRVDAVKASPALWRQGFGSRRGSAVMRALCALAADLSVDVIAVGVETAGELEALRAAGCRLAQGFHLGRPAAPEAALRELGAR